MANVNQVFLWGANNSLPATKTNGQAYFATIGNEAYGDSVPTKEAYIYFDKDNERYNVIAKRAIFDAAGNRIDTKYVTVDTAQTITGVKTFNNIINVSRGHVYLTGAQENSSTGNTTQLVFGTKDSNHVTISSNNNAIVINPDTYSTTNQIVLYLEQQSLFPSGLSAGATAISSTLSVTGATTLNNTLSVSGAASLSSTLSVDKTITGNKGLVISGRIYESGDDEGIIVSAANNGYAGLTLGEASGIRSVFYLKPAGESHRAVWRYCSDGSKTYEIYHPGIAGGLIVQPADTAVGSASIPVYIPNTGMATAVTCIATSVGGTGLTSFTANRLIWSSSNSVLTTSAHYVDATHLAINFNSTPNETLYVNGDTKINGILNIKDKVKLVYNNQSESLDFVFI